MKNTILILSTVSLLSACSSNSSESVHLSINQIDSHHYDVNLPASRSGENADSSFLRQVHRQTIGHKFINEKICPQGLNISNPTAEYHNDDGYQLRYNVNCKLG